VAARSAGVAAEGVGRGRLVWRRRLWGRVGWRGSGRFGGALGWCGGGGCGARSVGRGGGCPRARRCGGWCLLL